MLPDDEDIAVQRVAAAWKNGEDARSLATELSASYSVISAKAAWAYRHFCRRAGLEQIDADVFQSDYLDSWSRFLFAAAMAGSVKAPISEMPRDERTLYLLWHFPEYPLIAPWFVNRGGVILVARCAAWMKPMQRTDAIIDFRARGPVPVAEAFAKGKNISAMFDYCYSETSSRRVDFLGYPSRTADGVITLAKRYDYRICVLEWDGSNVSVFLELAPSLSLEKLLGFINEAIQNQIMKKPSEWLLWPSIDNRWFGVDYEK